MSFDFDTITGRAEWSPKGRTSAQDRRWMEVHGWAADVGYTGTEVERDLEEDDEVD